MHGVLKELLRAWLLLPLLPLPVNARKNTYQKVI
jgi:hypothetical protein